MTHPPPTLHRPGATSGMSRASAMRRLLPPLLVGFIVIDAAGSVDTGLQVLTPQPRPDAGYQALAAVRTCTQAIPTTACFQGISDTLGVAVGV